MKLFNLLKDEKKDGVKVFYYPESFLYPKYCFDYHHLNSDGVMFFSRKYLLPIL